MVYKMVTALLCALLSTTLYASEVLKVATTTSTANSGLLDAIIPDFESRSGHQVHIIAVGTGKALRMGRDGDVDVVLVHAPGAEEQFIQAGYGVDRRSVMYNDYIVIGPKSDPAGIRGEQRAEHALAKIASGKHRFVSRGDDSGTHKKELSLWKVNGTVPDYQHYYAAGQGMGKVLQMANELQAYTLTDRGTWLAYQSRLDLEVLVAGDERLYNPYSVISINPTRYPDINKPAAMKFSDWLTSNGTCQRIRDFRVHGEQLFTPYCSSELGQK